MANTSKEILKAAVMGFGIPVVLLIVAIAILLPGRKENREPDNQISQSADAQTPQLQKMDIPVFHDGQVSALDLEIYVVRVVLAEMPASFEMEALKAQAVASRTFALRTCADGQKHDGAVCTSYRCCQAYREPEEYLRSGGTRQELQKVHQAVLDTAREVLYYDEELICATYFASSGGRTEDAREVWGQDYPYLKSVESPGEENCGYFGQDTSYTPQELQELLGVTLEGKPPSWFGMVTYTPGGGVDLMRIGGKLYTGVELRRKLGLRSTAFEVVATDEVILIKTKGYGHRVGMSQHGANAMAQNGSTYKQILNHYYIGTTLRQYSPGND